MVNGISGSGQTSANSIKGNCNPCTGCGDCGNPKIQTLSQILKNSNAMKKPEELFKQMSLEAGGDGTKVNKEQLQTLEAKLAKEGKNTDMIKDLIANFDKIANGKDSITADDLKTAMENGILKPPHKKDNAKSHNTNEIQNPSTVTKEQLESPIDIRV